MTKKNDVNFRWLQVQHILEDFTSKNDPTGSKAREALRKKFYIKERKTKSK